MSKQLNKQTVTERLRAAILNAGETRYSIAKRTGVDEATLCRFVAGSKLKSDSIDLLCEALDLELTPKRKLKSKPKCKGK